MVHTLFTLHGHVIKSGAHDVITLQTKYVIKSGWSDVIKCSLNIVHIAHIAHTLSDAHKADSLGMS